MPAELLAKQSGYSSHRTTTNKRLESLARSHVLILWRNLKCERKNVKQATSQVAADTILSLSLSDTTFIPVNVLLHSLSTYSTYSTYYTTITVSASEGNIARPWLQHIVDGAFTCKTCTLWSLKYNVLIQIVVVKIICAITSHNNKMQHTCAGVVHQPCLKGWIMCALILTCICRIF